MLIEFEVGNFFSFREPVRLSMVAAAPIKEFRADNVFAAGRLPRRRGWPAGRRCGTSLRKAGGDSCATRSGSWRRTSRGASDLYSLAEFKLPTGDKVRNDAAFERNYIQGRYGATPYLCDFAGLPREQGDGETSQAE